jgi:hypothetical protein
MSRIEPASSAQTRSWHATFAKHLQTSGEAARSKALVEGRGRFWRVDESKLGAVARMAATALARRSASYRFGPYGPLGQLAPDGYDRLAALHGRFDALGWEDHERARSLADLVALAHLLDVDPGPAFRTRTRTGALLGGDEANLVIAYALFVQGALSLDGARDPLRVDGEALAAIDASTLALAYAGSEREPAQGLDERLRRLRVTGAARCDEASQREARRLGARSIDALLSGATVTMGELYERAARCLSAAVVARDDDSQRWIMTDADVLYARLAWSWAPLFARLDRAVEQVDETFTPPDRWSCSLLIDTALLAAADDAPAHELVREREARCELLSLASATLDAIVAAVRLLTHSDPARLSKASILQWGTSVAGRALSSRQRGAGIAVIW